jgi:hypothetical protein
MAECARPRAQQGENANMSWNIWPRRNSPSLLRPRTGALRCQFVGNNFFDFESEFGSAKT